ncbi:hypothetical protein C8J57DRAFT_1235925 [Mycena rebaudengoi]|nr:hypothetical protein C8J57DRAFT_1235925 [Mycena rebaudengoi]
MVVHTLCSAPVRTAAISWACAVGVACSLGDEARRPVYDVAGTQSGLAHLQQKVRPPSSAVGTRSDPAARSHYGESSAWDRAQCAPRPVRRGRCFNGALMSRGKGSARSPPVTASKRKHLEAIAQLGERVIPVPKNLKRAKRDALENKSGLDVLKTAAQLSAARPRISTSSATDRRHAGSRLHLPTPRYPRTIVSLGESKSDRGPAPAEGEEDIADNTLKMLVKGTLKLTYHKWPARFYADDSYKASDPRKGLSFAATSFCGPAYVDGAQLCVQRCHKSQACQQRSPGRRLSSPEMIVNVFSTHRTTSGPGTDDASDDEDGDSDDEAIQAQRVARCGGVAAASRPRDNSRLLYYALQWNYYASSLGGLVTLKLECSFVSLCRLLLCMYSGPNLSHIQCPAFCSVAQFNIFYSLLFILDGPEIGMSQIGLENGFKGVKRLGMCLKVLAPFGDGQVCHVMPCPARPAERPFLSPPLRPPPAARYMADRVETRNNGVGICAWKWIRFEDAEFGKSEAGIYVYKRAVAIKIEQKEEKVPYRKYISQKEFQGRNLETMTAGELVSKYLHGIGLCAPYDIRLEFDPYYGLLLERRIRSGGASENEFQRMNF